MDYSLLGFSGLAQMYNIHPAFVHFPVALFPAALLFYLLGTAMKGRSLFVAGRACLYLAALGTAAAVWTGLAAGDSIPHNEAIHHIMETHEAIGIALLVSAAVLSAWSFWQADQRPRGAWFFLAGLAFSTFLALQNGDLGSRMVYLEGAGVRPAVSVISPSPAAEERPKDLPDTHGQNQGHPHGGHSHNHSH
ncbi:MAG: DUF2231 domain-containing protein [Elusimicrobia bacterium]|nr:DUF2231 domain-containing protein [Elusimicrobiota bacterium]